MTEREIEAVAKAIYERICQTNHAGETVSPWSELLKARDYYMDLARAAIAALDKERAKPGGMKCRSSEKSQL